MEKDLMKLDDELQRLKEMQSFPLVKGRYYDNLLGEFAGVGYYTTVIKANLLYAFPIFLFNDVAFDRIGVVKTTDTETSVIRLGIYGSINNSDESIFPGHLVIDAGEMKLANKGTYELCINQGLSSGIYWLVLIASENNLVRLRGYSRYTVGGSIGGFASLGEVNNCTLVTRSQVYGPLPSLFGEGEYSITEYYAPKIGIRVQPDMLKKPMPA